MRGEQKMKKYFYLFVVFFILLSSWDFTKNDMAIAASNTEEIPDEAIRLRIIANSDSAEDQWIKREIRDEVTEEINKWVSSIDDIDEARVIINDKLPELEEIVSETLTKNGYTYQEGFTVDFGLVPFPTKMYGDMVYQAGEYEALRITLGEGKGENWWCVLFPPLCFVDMSNGDAVEVVSTVDTIDNNSNQKDVEEEVEVKFFIAELFSKLFDIL